MKGGMRPNNDVFTTCKVPVHSPVSEFCLRRAYGGWLRVVCRFFDIITANFFYCFYMYSTLHLKNIYKTWLYLQYPNSTSLATHLQYITYSRFRIHYIGKSGFHLSVESSHLLWFCTAEWLNQVFMLFAIPTCICLEFVCVLYD